MRPRSARGIRQGRRPGDPTVSRGRPPEGSLDDLRTLVVGPEQARLDRLEQRPVPTPDTVGAVLPEALASATAHRREELTISLEPVLTSAVRTVAEKDADMLGEILSPTIGVAVRKAVTDAIAVMLQRFNEVLERSLSLRSIDWRLEAWRTRQPLSEVVLLHTLIYRVEEVFLIHPRTSLVLEHVAAEGVSVAEPDQVTSMLEAISAFVHEAFRPQSPGMYLNEMQVGDLTVWVDRDASLVIAAVVRGAVPKDFSDVLREARERIHLTHQSHLASFRADVSPFASARPTLERCLRQQRRAPPKRAHIWLAIGAALTLGLIALFAVKSRMSARAEARSLGGYVEALQAEPGIVVTSAEHTGRRFSITGLRDPMATPPDEVIARHGFSPATLRFEPFYSLDPRVVEKRIQRSFAPPDGVNLKFDAGTLHAEGTAPEAWIERARVLARTLPGIEAWDEDALHEEQAVQALRVAATGLEAVVVPFARGSSAVSAAALQGAVARSAELMGASAAARLGVCIVTAGHADSSGSEDTNQRLSDARANHVADRLEAKGTNPGFLRRIGLGARPEAGKPTRAVTFHVSVGAACAGEQP